MTIEKRISDYEKLIEVTESHDRKTVEDQILDDMKLDMLQAHRLLSRLFAKFDDRKKHDHEAEEPEINNHAAFVAQYLPRRIENE